MQIESHRYTGPFALADLAPTARFNAESTFGRRIAERDDAKMRVAAYTAGRFGFDGGAAFVTDGSSTFFVGLALALRTSEHAQQYLLRTNNMAVVSELEERIAAGTWDGARLHLDIPSGRMNYELQATFPLQGEEIAKQFVHNIPYIIVSVRELDPLCGPTSLDEPSRLLKYMVMHEKSQLIIVTEWRKIAAMQQTIPVFLDDEEWIDIVRSRKTWIICDKPDGVSALDLEANKQALSVANAAGISHTDDRRRYLQNIQAMRDHPGKAYARTTLVEVE